MRWVTPTANVAWFYEYIIKLASNKKLLISENFLNPPILEAPFFFKKLSKVFRFLPNFDAETAKI